MNKMLISLGLAMLIAACATTQPPAQSTAATATQAQMVVSRGTQEDGQHMICTSEYPMGSHIPQRICLTKDQMKARQKAAQDAMRNLQMQNKEGTACAPNCV